MKGETMAKDNRVKMTLLLDSDTINILKEYSYVTNKNTNVSNAIREIAKTYGKEKLQQNKLREAETNLA